VFFRPSGLDGEVGKTKSTQEVVSSVRSDHARPDVRISMLPDTSVGEEPFMNSII
jgi:hypothetical protein